MGPLVAFLRRVLKLQALVLLGARFDDALGAAVIRVRRRSNTKARCATHGCALGGTLTTSTKRWRHLDLAGTTLYLEAAVREGRCPRCDGRRTESVPWAAHRAEHTWAFDRYVARLVQLTDKTAVAALARVAWRTVGAIVERVVARFLPPRSLDGIWAIGVDETAFKRGHHYLTVVVNLETGDALWSAEGKSAETLGKFFDELGPERCARLEVVAMDMSGAYEKAVRERCPQADIIFDRFHVVQLLLDAVDEVRRTECRGHEDAAARKDLKGTRFALLRNPRHLRPQDRAAIALVAAKNRRLTRAYQLRVDFETLWEQKDEAQARAFLRNWTRAALRSRLRPLQRVAKTLRQRMEGVLGFFRWEGASNAQSEGRNNKIKMLIHRAYGFHSAAAILAMIQLCCSSIAL